MTPSARRVALDALLRIDTEGAYANLVLPPMLHGSRLGARDRAFVTELVYGTTRMRRACDWVAGRFVNEPERIEPIVRNVLRLGSYQLVFLRTPAHAAVATSVDLAPERARGLVTAVLRKVASEAVRWPDPPPRLSDPRWLRGRLAADLRYAAVRRTAPARSTGCSSMPRAPVSGCFAGAPTPAGTCNRRMSTPSPSSNASCSSPPPTWCAPEERSSTRSAP